MKLVEIPSSHNIVLQYQLASLSYRIFAWIIDFIIMLISSSTLGALVGWSSVLPYFVIIPIFFFYNLAFEMFWQGQTIGKRLLGIRVVTSDGEQMSLKALLLRWSFRFVDIGLSMGIVGILSVFSNSRNQRIGDILANTIVINTKYNSFFSLASFKKLESADHEILYPEVVDLYNDEQMLNIKNVLQRLDGSPSPEVHDAANKLFQLICDQMAVVPHTKNKKVFLQYILKDYIILSR